MAEAKATRLHGEPIPMKWYPPNGQQGNAQQGPNVSNSQPADLGEDGQPANFIFNEQSIRKAFISKVYSILMAQLMITMSFIALFTFHEPTIDWVHRNDWLIFLAFAILLVTLISMACCTNVRRKTPMNFIFLFTFTVAMSFMLGITASTFRIIEVMMAVGMTAAICFTLTIFALQTKWDFTAIGSSLLVILTIFLMYGIMAIFFPRNELLNLLYACLGVLIFSLYLVYDTQLMLGGKHKYALSPEEYIFAALNLYLDIMNIFLYILSCLGR